MIAKEISYAFYCENGDCGESESYFLGSGGPKKDAIQMARKNGWKIIHPTGYQGGSPVPRNVICPKCR